MAQANATAADQPWLLPVPATLAPAKQYRPRVVSAAIGKANLLSAAEFGLLCGGEAIRSGWNTFVAVCPSLAEIRDQQLYRNDFESFEAYCQAKWNYKRAYVYQLITAAQVFNHLSANCRHRQPDHESQLRPLMGLSLDDAKLAWERAAQIAGARKITADLVKRAMRQLELKKTHRPDPPHPIQVNKARQRELIDQTFGELLVLVAQKAAYEVITQKVEALHTHVHALFVQMRPPGPDP